MKEAKGCYCQYNGCNGAVISRTQRREHEKKDELARIRTSLGMRAAQRVRTEAVCAPLPYPLSPAPLHHLPLVLPPLFPRPITPSQPAVPSDSNLSPQHQRVSAHVQDTELNERAAAEERGRVYADQVAAKSSSLDNIGDLDEDGDAEDLEDHVVRDQHDGNRGFATPTMHTASPSAAAQNAKDDLPLREVPDSDPRYPGENTPDPFYVPCSTAAVPSFHPSRCFTPFYILYMLVAWLHTQCKLAFKACGAVLVVVANILAAAEVVPQEAVYGSLTSVLNYLNAEPTFQVLAVCPSCIEPYPVSRKSNSTCDRCGGPLFKSTNRHDRRQQDLEAIATPLLQYPVMSIESQLRALLDIPGMEDELEQWREVQRTPGKYNDMFDGRIAQGIKGPDARPFFENPVPPRSTELRIGLVLGFDW
jgi:hypothetical protein